ncbi:IS701 family transposase [Streptomyces sp. NPDC003023]|uniref:IS701 family transposase n=1 Tax=Streptomyces sp. NPDC003023 TaxID=3364675 RepID=UPI003684BAAA
MAVQVVTPTLGARASESFDSFAQDLFADLPRSDQRRWAHAYLRGLLNAPGKKSLREVAAACGIPDAASALQQFVNSSPWDWEPVRRATLRRTQERDTAQALTIGLAVLPKRGGHSAGVHRRFVPELGRIVNCQAGVGLFMAGAHANVPVDWRMLLPGRWSQDTELMSRARIPAQNREQSVSALVLGLVDALAEDLPALPAPLVADMSHDRYAGTLARALSDRGHDFVVALPHGTPVIPLEQEAAPQPVASLRGEAMDVRRLLSLHGRTVTSVQDGGGDGTRIVRVSTCLVRLPGAGRGRAVRRVFAPWPAAGRGPGRIWVTNLTDERTERLLALAGAADSTARTVGELTADFGMTAFEGRSYPGWHHHMTLVSAAYAYARGSGAAQPAVLPAAA